MGRPTPTKPSRQSRKHCILVISPDTELCAAVEAFRGTNCKVVCASDGQSGSPHFQRQRPHLVILDETLPDIDGLAVFEQIRSRTPNVPVIVVGSSTTGIRVVFAFLKAAAANFLPKPADRVALQSAMRNATFPRPEDDTPALVSRLISKYVLETKRNNVTFTPEAINVLLLYDFWAGSQKVDELIAQTVTLNRSDEITAKDLSLWGEIRYVQANKYLEWPNDDAQDTKQRHWC